MANKDLKIALVHDYLPTYGGAEAVLSALHEAFPEAPIYTIFSNVGRVHGSRFTVERDVLSEKFQDAKIITSWFDFLPYRERLMSPFLFLIPLIWASFDFSEYDLVISSASWAITKGFGGGPIRLASLAQGSAGKPVEICYCHTPPRYLYGYDTSGPWKKYLPIRIYAAICAHFMRIYDFKRAQKVTQFVANSREVAARIQKFYRRDSVVINPPVEILITNTNIEILNSKQNRNSKHDYYLTGGRLEAAKNFDLIISACNELGANLKVFGDGGERERLKALAGPNVEFLGKISEQEKYRLMADCKGFIVAAKDEDFGITPVEAMACGAPVVAYHGGGYLETVVGDPPSRKASAWQGRTGVFFDQLNVESLTKAILKLPKMKIKSSDCLNQAGKFSKERFIKEIKSLVSKYARAS